MTVYSQYWQDKQHQMIAEAFTNNPYLRNGRDEITHAMTLLAVMTEKLDAGELVDLNMVLEAALKIARSKRDLLQLERDLMSVYTPADMRIMAAAVADAINRHVLDDNLRQVLGEALSYIFVEYKPAMIVEGIAETAISR